MTVQKINKKVINAWATYDLANSVYNLVITATLFPIYYKAVTTTKDAAGKENDGTTADALVQGSTGAVMQTVATTPNTIGYVSLGSLSDTVKAVDVEGVTPTTETVLSGEYKISRPFIYITGGELTEAAQMYIDFVMSAEGQALVEENGFIKVN